MEENWLQDALTASRARAMALPAWKRELVVAQDAAYGPQPPASKGVLAEATHAVPPRAAVCLSLLVDTLTQAGIRYRVTGGLAARIYGSPRSLADIDVDVDVANHEVAQAALTRAGFEILRPAAWYEDAHWRIFLSTLRFGDQEVDLCAATSAQVFAPAIARWVDYPDLGQRTMCRVAGQDVFVIPRETILYYKLLLARDVDRDDVGHILLAECGLPENTEEPRPWIVEALRDAQKERASMPDWYKTTRGLDGEGRRIREEPT